MKTYTIYKIYYGSMLVYVGRTKLKLQTRLHGHFFNKAMHKYIDIFKVTKVEYAETKTVADMYLYEIYYINKYKPPINRDDKADDELTIELPELVFKPYEIKLIDKWKKQRQEQVDNRRKKDVCSRLSHEKYQNAKLIARKELTPELFDEWLKNNHISDYNITDEEYFEWCLTNKLPY